MLHDKLKRNEKEGKLFLVVHTHSVKMILLFHHICMHHAKAMQKSSTTII